MKILALPQPLVQENLTMLLMHVATATALATTSYQAESNYEQSTFPLILHNHGPKVGDLQDALQLLLDRSTILANDAAARKQLSTALKRERDRKTYGSTTRKLVGI